MPIRYFENEDGDEEAIIVPDPQYTLTPEEWLWIKTLPKERRDTLRKYAYHLMVQAANQPSLLGEKMRRNREIDNDVVCRFERCRPSVVYLMHDRTDDTYKIGYSSRIRKRLEQIAYAISPNSLELHELVLIDAIAGEGFEKEQELHRHFAACRIGPPGTEWFRFTPEHVAEFRRIAAEAWTRYTGELPGEEGASSDV